VKNTIICAAYNNLELTKITYDSLTWKTKNSSNIILINNGSTDKTLEWMEEETVDKIPQGGSQTVYVTVDDGLPEEVNFQVTFVNNPMNGGCGIGRNVGLRLVSSDSEYVTLIDNDIVLTQGWDTEMINYMDAHPEVGLCGPATNYAGTPQLLPKTMGLPTKLEEIEPFSLKYKESNRGRVHGVPPGFVVIGFCMMIRKKALDQVGLFDEQFKLYGNEDNDYCLRMVQAGWKLMYYMGVYVHHWGGKTLSILGDEGIRQWDENRKAFDAKWRRK
jgi:hypothetical protein